MLKIKKNKTLEKSQPPPQSSEALNFTHALTRVAVAQICQSVGYTSAKSSALQTLTKVAALHLKTLTNLAATSANRLGRTESNLLDVVVALEDLGYVKGFKGGSDVNRGLLKSSVLLDLVDFVDRVDEIPFAQSIRRLKDVSSGIGGESDQSGVRDNVDVVGAVMNVPIWLPRFPDVNMFKENDVEGKGGRFGSGEVLFPNGGVEGVSVSGNFEVGKRGRGGGELHGDRCRVKFWFTANRKTSGTEVGVGADICGEGVFVGGVGVTSDENEKEKKQIWNGTESDKEKKKKARKACVHRRLLSNKGERRIVQRKKEVL